MLETFQQPDWSERWHPSGSFDCKHGECGSYETSIITSPFGHSNAVKVHGSGHFWYWYPGLICANSGAANIKNIFPESTNYWAFELNEYYAVGGWRESTWNVSLELFDNSGNSIGSYIIGYRKSTFDAKDGETGLYEIYKEGNYIYLTIDGVSKGIIATSSKKLSYIQLKTSGYGASCYIVVDNISTFQPGVINIATERQSHLICELDNNEIDVTWHVTTIPYEEFEYSEYKLNVINLFTNEVIDTRVIPPLTSNGAEQYSKASLFGTKYGAYLFTLTKNDEVITSDYLIYRQIPPPESCLQSFTVLTDEEPVPDASIIIRNYITDELIETAKTGEFGIYASELDTSKVFSIESSKVGYECQDCSKAFAACLSPQILLYLSKIPGDETPINWLLIILIIAIISVFIIAMSR